MPPSPQSESLILPLVVIGLIFGLSAIVYAILYLRTQQELKNNAPWLYFRLSSIPNTVKKVKDKHASSKRSAICKLLSKELLDRLNRKPFIKARSIVDFINKVKNSETRSFHQLIETIIRRALQCVNVLQWYKRLSYSLRTIARRIKEMLRETLVLAWGIVLVALIVLLGTVTAPLFSEPANWLLILSRFYKAIGGFIVGIVLLLLIWKWMKNIDSEKENKFSESIKEAFKEAIKEYNKEEKLLYTAIRRNAACVRRDTAQIRRLMRRTRH